MNTNHKGKIIHKAILVDLDKFAPVTDRGESDAEWANHIAALNDLLFHREADIDQDDAQIVKAFLFKDRLQK